MRPSSRTAFGLAGVNLHTWTGWGSVTHWNAFVANLEMQGQGTFFDPRVNDAAKFPIAALAGFADVRRTPDLITAKLAPLHVHQLNLPAPRPPRGSFDVTAAERGEALFAGKADCARCHVPPLTEPSWNMHRPEEIGIDGFQAERSPDEHYRTAPLKGLWTHTTGGSTGGGCIFFLRASGRGLAPSHRIEYTSFIASMCYRPTVNMKRYSARENAQAYRARMKKLGFRQVNLWVPDTRSPGFRKECRRQSRLAAAADRSERIDGLLDAAAGSVKGWT